MSKNPCRNCKNAFVYRNRHVAGLNCHKDCQKYKAHQEYLENKRMFKKGEIITSIEELLSEEWVIWANQTRHIEAIKSMPLRTVIVFIEKGFFHKAIRKEGT